MKPDKREKNDFERGNAVYRIVVLAARDEQRSAYADHIARFCHENGLFPQVDACSNQEQFFESVQKAAPTNAVIALPGVAGLNAVEHLRSLCPACGIIWCSDLNFSLQAFRLRIEYFILEPVTAERFQQGLIVWLQNKAHSNRIEQRRT